MTISATIRSGKGHRDENFPVASMLVRARHRPLILGFYEFVRTADDVADHATLAPAEKLARLDDLEASVRGDSAAEPEGVRLHALLEERGLTPDHAIDLLQAFRQDVTKRRYADWADLIDYCRLSAMPVGRFVLDVHGESRALWPASDAICAALQIINHLQDCGADYRNLDRVYVPQESLAAQGLDVTALGAEHASPPLLACLRGLAGRTALLLEEGRLLPLLIADGRLALEIAAIHGLAQRICGLLMRRDPLSERVHLSKGAMLRTASGAGALTVLRRMRPRPRWRAPSGDVAT